MYRKNTASQFVCVQLLLTATGAVATGLSPTVRRCIDGTFAAGGGTVTEDGSTGSYKYAMAQADTNGNDISLVFTATGAMPVVVNFVTTAADPTDGVRLGLTALPNAAASAIGGLPLAVDTSGRVDVLKINGTSQTARDIGASVIAASGTVTTVTNQLTAAQIATGVWQDTTAGDFTTALSVGKSIMNGVALGTGLTVNDITTKTGYTASTVSDKTGYALTSGERTSIADVMLDRDMSTGTDSGSPSVRTVRQALRFLRNKFSISAGTLTVCKEDDSTASWTSAITTTAGNPISQSDPA